MWTNPAVTANLVERKNVFPQEGKKRQKRKSSPRKGWEKVKSHLNSEVSLERTVGGAHCRNIKHRRKGVKKEQVKGCGSVNRPTPGSQRPAEPVATGLLQGVKTSKNRGQFSGLGVKLWVVDDGLSQCRAIPYGVRIGVTTISCCEQGKQSARLSAEHNWRG